MTNIYDRLREKLKDMLSPDADVRMDICKVCPSFTKDTTVCQECGCFMIAKTKLRGAMCPLDKWPKEASTASPDINKIT
jgi:hypothetical protein